MTPGVRIGQGFDVHAFAAGADPPRRLVLGGVEIPDGPPLTGHSDADVVLHAVADAVLGAAGLGDLGSIFGTDDPASAGAASVRFVAEAVQRARQTGWEIGNVDCTVVAARPRLAPHRDAMVRGVAAAAGVPPDRVSVKATTTDGLGFTGRGEGIACTAVVLLVAR